MFNLDSFVPNSLIFVDINENGLAELTRDFKSTKEMSVPFDVNIPCVIFDLKNVQKFARNLGR